MAMLKNCKNRPNGLQIFNGHVKNCNNNGLPILMGVLKMVTIMDCQY